MATDAELLAALKQAATDGVSSQSFGADGSSSGSQMSVEQQIAAYRFAKEVAAMARNHKGLTLLQIQPPGALNDI